MKNNQIVKKGFEINLNRIEEGYLYCEVVCVSETREEARKTLLAKSLQEGMIIKNSGEEPNYLTIPIIRCPEADIILYNGEEMSRSSVEDHIRKEKRDRYIKELEDGPHEFYHIRKGGLYYRDNSAGYTEHYMEAGVYKKVSAISSAKSCDEIVLIPLEVDEHNAKIKEAIEKLENRIIS